MDSTIVIEIIQSYNSLTYGGLIGQSIFAVFAISTGLFVYAMNRIPSSLLLTQEKSKITSSMLKYLQSMQSLIIGCFCPLFAVLLFRIVSQSTRLASIRFFLFWTDCGVFIFFGIALYFCGLRTIRFGKSKNSISEEDIRAKEIIYEVGLKKNGDDNGKPE